MSKFLRADRPTVTLMLRGRTLGDILEEIALGLEEGADAFGLQLEGRPSEVTDKAGLSAIISAMKGRPAYVTDYCTTNDEGDLLSSATHLVHAAECGAALVDIRADMFDISPGEFTRDAAAVEKQQRLARELRARGAEVLYSSHIYKYGDGKMLFTFLPYERVYAVLAGQRDRGADVAKIVTSADTEEELAANCETTLRLRRELGIPFLFLCNGAKCYRHRRLSPVLGSSMALVTESSVRGENQPPIDEMWGVLGSLGFPGVPGR